MPTDSIVRRGRSFLRALVVLAVVLAGGCARPPSVVHDALLEPLGVRQPWLPSDADLAAARLARAALVAEPTGSRADPRVERELAALEALDEDAVPEHLVPLAIDLRNATLDDPLADRAGARRLRRRRGLDPRLTSRLDQAIRDDPLRLAGRRQFDGWHRLWARTFNAVAEPLGTSAITGFVLAPYQLANSLIHWAAAFSNAEPLSVTDRQALALREEFLARHPDTDATPALERRIARDRIAREKTLALRRLRAADTAMDQRAPALAAYQAESALRRLDASPEGNRRTRRRAETAREAAHEALTVRNAELDRALEARPSPAALARVERDLAAALLVGDPSPRALEALLATYREAARQADDAANEQALEAHAASRIEFVRAFAQHESGSEAAARARLTRAARGDPADDTMLRHARALLDDDWQNPHGAFERLRRKARRDEFAYRVAGEWVNRPRYPNLPTPVAYLIDTPTIAMTVILAPLRALISPITDETPDFQRATALTGYRYLIRHPEGEERREVVDWLFAYESQRERWGRALRLADWIPEFDPEERAELVEKTTGERLARVERIERRDARRSILTGVAREFPDSEGGRQAGLQARAERQDASPQSIRVSRGFLIENPGVAGPDGLGLNPDLLNERLGDGELHPDGIVLRGGRMLEVRLVADGGDEDEAPESRFLELSTRRLGQLAATLDEAVQRNSLIDVDARFAPDPGRDVYLERASLELADDLDLRPTAASDFAYLSLRERYGMVRGRDSVLPFDLVFRGSFGDFSLGAFPRWRAPRETPDAFLYR